MTIDETTSVANLDQELLEVDSGWVAAYLQRDRESFNRIWSKRFVFTFPFGRFCNSERELANLDSGILSLASLSSKNVTIRMYGSTVIMAGDFTMQGRYEDKDISGRYSYTNVLRRRWDDNKWQIIASQASQLH